MTKKWLATLLLAAASGFAADFSVGVRIGAPPAPRVVRVRPVAPGPGWVWVDGYWFAEGRRWRWHDGYWTRAPYEGAVWVRPRYEGGMYYQGYWEGGRGRFGHEHRWDRDHDRRDWDRWR